MDAETILQYAGVLSFLLLSLSVHESAHAWTADRLGDPTARALGRVTLNPAAHLDLFLSVLLPLVTYWAMGVPFGAGKPVPVNVLNLGHPRRDWMLVALAGPCSNLLLALLTTIAWFILDAAGLVEPHSIALHLFRVGVLMNVSLAVFNLIPIPTLDGSRVIGYLLPEQAAIRWYELDRYGFLILLGLLMLPNIAPGLDVLRLIVVSVSIPILGLLNGIFGLPI
ncbi:MAG: site-2 protease family protein [Planctomycetes bacterium]|nr:site-2 protease family protein [Planctomycetota bacterium]